jgi:hypothetical protein
VKRTTFFAAFACALLIFSLLGCGTSNHLQSITLTAKNSQATGGLYDLKGWGGTLQMVATGNYGSGKTRDLSNVVTYTVTPDGTDADGVALLAPPNTVQFSPTGLITAVDPTVCTFINLGTTDKPVWALRGSYQVVASFQGVSSQPVFVAVASAITAGQTQCGP